MRNHNVLFLVSQVSSRDCLPGISHSLGTASDEVSTSLFEMTSIGRLNIDDLPGTLSVKMNLGIGLKRYFCFIF